MNPILAIDFTATTSVVTLAVLFIRKTTVDKIPTTKNKYPTILTTLKNIHIKMILTQPKVKFN